MTIRPVGLAVVALAIFMAGAPRVPFVAAAGPGVTAAVAAAPISRVVNSITVTDRERAARSNYLLQFGRPFVRGAIPHMPQVLIDGVAAPSQADVKNRYPDGSVEFAVIAVVIPRVPAGGSVTLGFQDTTATGSTPLTSAQMLDPAYNFDAAMNFTADAGGAQRISARTMLQNGDCRPWTQGPVAQTMICADDTAARKYDFGFASDGAPGGFRPLRPRFYATFWPQTHQVAVRAVVESGLTTEYEDAAYKVTITAGQAAPVTVYSADLSGKPTGAPITGLTINKAVGYAANFTGYIAIAGRPSSPLPDGHFNATIGGETVELSAPTYPQVYLWARGVSGSAPAALTNGEAIVAARGLPKRHWAGTAWTQRFWLGGTPSPRVDIDNNLAYLASTRFLPHFDAATAIDPNAVTSEYALWTGKPHDLYDGVWDGGLWENGMGTPGARQDIGPYPTWTTMWLYTGDWRLRQMALGMADLAASWSYHLRETDPTKIFNRGDPAGTGLGRPVSIVGRPTLVTWDGDLNYQAAPADRVTIVGPVAASHPWTFEGSHEPAAFYPQYVVTGDPWYLGEMEFWANWDAARYIVSAGAPYGRGPDGSYGGVNDEVRGAGWVMRERAETAFAVPDGDPEKIYLGTLVNDALARWEGSFGIAGTGYDGTAMKNWGVATGDYWTFNGGPNSGKAPTLHYWESNGNPAAGNTSVSADVAAGWFVPGAVGSVTDPWMHWYSLYCLGRVAELGFAAGPFQQYTGQWLTSIINTSGLPSAITIYEAPAEIKGGGFPATYAAWLALFNPAYLTGAGWNPALGVDLAHYFQNNLTAQGRPAYAMAALAPLVDDAAPGAAQAWGWLDINVRRPIAMTTVQTPFSKDPSWNIVPRTDRNTLPAQPTKAPSP